MTSPASLKPQWWRSQPVPLSVLISIDKESDDDTDYIGFGEPVEALKPSRYTLNVTGPYGKVLDTVPLQYDHQRGCVLTRRLDTNNTLTVEIYAERPPHYGAWKRM